MLSAISECKYCLYSNSLNARGWVLEPADTEKIEIFIDDNIHLGIAQLGKYRGDVFKNYPQFENINSGWEFNIQLPLSIVEKGILKVDFYKDSQKLGSLETSIVIDRANLVLFNEFLSENPQIDYNPNFAMHAEQILATLKSTGISTKEHYADKDLFKKWYKQIDYCGNYPGYTSEYLPEVTLPRKAWQHFLSIDLLTLKSTYYTYLDIGSSSSVFAKILHRLHPRARTYRQDLNYQAGIHGQYIGSDAANIPLPDSSVDSMGLHCAWEHFENNADIQFIEEAARLLKSGGKFCIIPLYLANDYFIFTSPQIWKNKYSNASGRPVFDPNAKIVINHSKRQRQEKYFSVDALLEMVIIPYQEEFKFTIFYFSNHQKHDGCPAFALVGEKR